LAENHLPVDLSYRCYNYSVILLQLKNDARLGIKRYDIDKDAIQLYFDEVCHVSSAYYPCKPVSRRAWEGCSSLSVCLSVCPVHNSKTNDPLVFKLGRPIGNDLEMSQKCHVLGFQGHGLVRVRLRKQQYGVGSNSMSAF